jgi:hypothetical protein
LLLFLAALAGCADGDQRAARERTDTPVAQGTVAPATSPKPEERGRKKQQASRRAATPVPTPNASAYVACDANITVKAATTTCPFAQNVFYEYWTAGGDDFDGYSPVSKQSYAMACRGRATIACTAGDGAEVRFSARAVALYDKAQADEYAASHDLGPDADIDESYDDEYAGGGYDESYDDDYGDDDLGDSYDDYEDAGYNDGDGVTEPGENIPYYDEGNGYRVQCEDGTYSHSGGSQGARSHHGGVR